MTLSGLIALLLSHLLAGLITAYFEFNFMKKRYLKFVDLSELKSTDIVLPYRLKDNYLYYLNVILVGWFSVINFAIFISDYYVRLEKD